MGMNTFVQVYTPKADGSWGHLDDPPEGLPQPDLRGWEWFRILSGKTISSEERGESPFTAVDPDDMYSFVYYYDIEKMRANVKRAFPEGNERAERFIDEAEQVQQAVGTDKAVIQVCM